MFGDTLESPFKIPQKQIFKFILFLRVPSYDK